MQDAYISISRKQGLDLYQLLLNRKAKYMVEFGTSFGVSTLYLAAAAQEMEGKVVTTELLPHKCQVAMKNFKEAEVDHLVDLRQGDATKTLEDLAFGVDFLLLDGWNDLYLPILSLVEPKMTSGALVYIDNVNFRSARSFMQYIKNHKKFRPLNIKNFSSRVALFEMIAFKW
jgi:predicted O-methyltransferase YrrM